MAAGVYVHIPFCQQKCFYCDFPSYAGKTALFEAYTTALCREIKVQGGSYFAAEQPDTVYIGGGTPSLLPVELLRKICQQLKSSIILADDTEWTVEINPGTADKVKLAVLKECGINRLSFGVQSFNDSILKRIGRIHTAMQAESVLKMAQELDFKNISLDLIYGLPGQTIEELQADINKAISIGVQHISIYGLQLEAGTVFDRLSEMGRLNLPDDELIEKMYDLLNEQLPANGFERYEISNFAKPGFQSRHNLKYWQDVPYLGIGSAASSYWNNCRWSNERGVAEYIASIKTKGAAVAETEELTRQVQLEEFCFLALRTTNGISKRQYAAKFGESIENIYGDVIRKMQEKGLLSANDEYIALTDQGMKFGNYVFSEFILE